MLSTANSKISNTLQKWKYTKLCYLQCTNSYITITTLFFFKFYVFVPLTKMDSSKISGDLKMQTEAAKLPTLLPTKHMITSMIIERVHKQLLQWNLTHTQISNKYWIPHGWVTVLLRLKGCTVYWRENAAPYKLEPIASLAQREFVKWGHVLCILKLGRIYLLKNSWCA